MANVATKSVKEAEKDFEAADASLFKAIAGGDKKAIRGAALVFGNAERVYRCAKQKEAANSIDLLK